MGKSSKKKPKREPGTFFDREIYKSKAYLALRGCASQVLTMFLSKRRFTILPQKNGRGSIYICENKDNLIFTYVEAEKKYGITKPRFARSLDQLLAKGFIHIVRHGGAYKKDCTQYSLSDAYKTWEPGMVIERRIIDPVIRGFRKPKSSLSRKNINPDQGISG